jgi:hypothetical protein
MHTTECKNCNKHYLGTFCPVCAQPASTGRIDSHYFLHDIPHSVFHVDKGFPYTFASLFTRPAGMLKEYLAGRRVKYFRPFAYVVLMSAICTFLIAQLDKVTDSLYLSYHPGAKITEAHGFFQHYFSVFIFLLIPVTALVTWLFFRKRQYNYWEHFLVNTYLGAQLNVLLLLIKISGLVKLLITHDSPEINISIFMTLFMLLYGFTFGGLLAPATRGFKGALILMLMNFVLVWVYITGLSLIGVITPWWDF